MRRNSGNCFSLHGSFMIICPNCNRIYAHGIAPLHCSCGVTTTVPIPNHWDQLHRYAVDNWNTWNEDAAMNWYAGWVESIPNYQCSCKEHWSELTSKRPLIVETAEEFFIWGWARHNDINTFLNKPPLSLLEAKQLYGIPCS